MNMTTSRDALEIKASSASREDSDIGRKDDARLRRLAESSILRMNNREQVIADHRLIRRQEEEGLDLEEEAAAAADADNDEDGFEERRRRIREKLLERQQEEEDAATIIVPEEEDEDEAADEEEEEEEDSVCETGFEEQQIGIGLLITIAKPPVFKPKLERDTLIAEPDRDRLVAEERALEELMTKRRLKEREVETRHIVVEEIRKDEEILQKKLEVDAAAAAVDTDDEINEAEEYEFWKAREFARIKRHRDDRDAMLKERRGNTIEKKAGTMTEEAPPKKKWRFMQTYYHKGAFFNSNSHDCVSAATTAGSDDVFTRDYSAPTGEDKMDKTILPKVMQVKHFGRRGRTKWTHLVNEDTTYNWNNLLFI